MQTDQPASLSGGGARSSGGWLASVVAAALIPAGGGNKRLIGGEAWRLKLAAAGGLSANIPAAWPSR